MVKHICHAKNCNVEVPPRMLMCLKHWRMVPKKLQKEVWQTYVEGQEITKDPTIEYLKVQKKVVNFVAHKEGII